MKTLCSVFPKPQNYERSKTKKYKSNMALWENMAYDAEKDESWYLIQPFLRWIYNIISSKPVAFRIASAH